MAHELEIRNGNASMLYVGETPWHGLGKKLDVAPATIEEAMRLAGLDWEIKLEPMYLTDGIELDQVAVVRQAPRSVLGIVSKDWEAVQNVKAFAPFAPFLEAKVATIETAGVLRGGKRVWMLAKVNRPDSVIVPRADDRVAKYLMVAIGHDGTLAFRIGYTPTRVVCMNTLSVAIHKGEASHVRISHVSGANAQIEQVTKMIEGVDARFEASAEVFRALAAIKIRSTEQLRAYVDEVYALNKPEQAGAKMFSDLLVKPRTGGKLPSPLSPEGGAVTRETKSRVFDEVARLFEHGKGNDAAGVRGTAWAAYNAVTEHLTWHRGKSQDARLENLWMKLEGPSVRALPAAVDQFLSN
jgi:phage/plasmid-like protein (TIGR03299 family)